MRALSEAGHVSYSPADEWRDFERHSGFPSCLYVTSMAASYVCHLYGFDPKAQADAEMVIKYCLEREEVPALLMDWR